MKRLLENKRRTSIIALAIIGSSIFAYWLLSAHTRSTENAYLSADVVNVAALVSGRITQVQAHDNQHVHKGDLLFEIDAEPFRIALTKAEADLAQALQTARQDAAEVAAMRAQLKQSEQDLKNARASYKRLQDLQSKQYVSQQSLEDAQTRMQNQMAVLDQSRARLNKALAAPSKPEQRADVLRARAAIAQAQLDLDHTRVTAAQDGQISNLTLAAGSLVATGAPLFALIVDDSFHIDANFKETELPGIHTGETVDIAIDMYPGQTFHGTIESLSGGTGTAFSLLPPQNATGNWVKIAQRVPVRIKLDATDAEHPLRIGATATVSVHLQ